MKAAITIFLFTFLPLQYLSATCSIDSLHILEQRCMDTAFYSLTVRIFVSHDPWDFLDSIKIETSNGGNGMIGPVAGQMGYLPFFDVPVDSLSSIGCPVDIMFDVAYFTENCSTGKTLLSSHEALDCRPISDFVSVEPFGQDSNFHLAEGLVYQYVIEHGVALTTGGTIVDQFDFTGYVPIEGSSENGHLSINSELAPGGVTILDIEFDPAIKRWDMTASEVVDFSGVVLTAANCSGAVTPWNTIITCEEVVVPTDFNGDSYNDLGWAIEIDPATRTVVNNQKLWALGNFKHENAVVHSNERTVYQGIDHSTGYLYKFVADVATDLSAGALYVYKGSKNGPGDWILIPNTTPSERNNVITASTSVGATVFIGIEDVEINPVDEWIYFAVKDEDLVYRFQDSDPITGTTVPMMEIYVGGTGASYNITHANGTTLEPWGEGPDNLTFDNFGNLYVLQDGSLSPGSGNRNHIWLIKNGHTQANPFVEIIARTPYDCEPTGITFSPDFRFLFMSIQHPSATNKATSQVDAFGNRRYFDRDVAIVIAREKNLGNGNVCASVQDVGSGGIPSGQYQADQQLISKNIISNNLDVLFRANTAVDLLEDFEVQLGGLFEVKMEGCDHN